MRIWMTSMGMGLVLLGVLVFAADPVVFAQSASSVQTTTRETTTQIKEDKKSDQDEGEEPDECEPAGGVSIAEGACTWIKTSRTDVPDLTELVREQKQEADAELFTGTEGDCE